ncbi:MAG: hypothetical protein NTV96_09330 [Actinobacteria bacterium]|nr:hypothetical protein [Actinomycetota bacterium]
MIAATFYRWLPNGVAQVATEEGLLLQVTEQQVAESVFLQLRVGQRLAIALSPTGAVDSIHLPQ